MTIPHQRLWRNSPATHQNPLHVTPISRLSTSTINPCSVRFSEEFPCPQTISFCTATFMVQERLQREGKTVPSRRDQNLARKLLDSMDSHNTSFIKAARSAEYATEQDDLSVVFLHNGYYSAFVELHIEHGPVFEGEGASIGTVTTIDVLASMKVDFEENGDHAVAVLRPSRNDAELAAAELTLTVERHVLDSDRWILLASLSFVPEQSTTSQANHI